MRPGVVLIQEQLQMSAMALHGLYEHYCEEGGVEGPTPELEAKIEAVREAGHAVEKAMAALTKAAT